MTDYCRLCAELKDPDEIVTSISVVEHSIELKLRSCCRWSNRNIEDHRLPHSVCASCLDKLDKCWLFSQSVQLAQQQLLEIFQENDTEILTKPYVAEFMPMEDNSTECFKNLSPSVDFTESVCDDGSEFDENQTIDDDAISERHDNKTRQQAANDQYACEMCDRVFNSKSALYHYRQMHTGERRFQCPLCDYSFTKKFSLYRHLVIHVQSSNGELKVERSNNRFHVVRTNGSGEPIDIGRHLYKCDECDKIFVSQFCLRDHRLQHSTERPFKCSLCDKSFKTHRNLTNHLGVHMDDKIELTAEECRPTAMDFNGDENQAARDDDGLNVINDQSTNSKSVTENRNEAEQSSDEQVAAATNKRTYPCEICGKVYNASASLFYHRQVHAGDRRFQCTLCDKSFTLKTGLDRHLLTHVRYSKGGLKIEEINNRFRIIQTNGDVGEPIEFSSHLYKCDECDEFLITPKSLQEHRVQHSSERPFICSLCDKSFKSHRSMKNHQGVHMVDAIKRDSVCDICSREFCTVEELNVHQGECEGLIEIDSIAVDCKPTAVDFTEAESDVEFDENQSIVDDGDLNRHQQKKKKHKTAQQSVGQQQTENEKYPYEHTTVDEERFKCPLCDNTFTMKFSLYRHLLVHVQRSNGELRIEETDEFNRFRIFQTNGSGEPIEIDRHLHKCDECDQIFIAPFELKKHRKTHKSFRTESSTKKHIQAHLANAKLNVHRQQRECKGLIKIGSTTEIAHENQATRDDDGLNVINEQSTNSKSFAENRHETEQPSDQQAAAAAANKRTYPCEICGKVYYAYASLHYHRQVHTGIRRFKCTLCDKSFTMKYVLYRHLLIHVGRSKGGLRIEKINNRFRIIQTKGGNDEPIDVGRHLYKCGECDQFFISPFELKEHASVKHSSECPFECWLCHKTFKTRRSLGSHIRLHTLDASQIKRNWVCELCGKAYQTHSAVNLHKQAVHSIDRPFKCETCGLRYKTKSQYKNHRMTHIESQFKCTKCRKSFASNQSLKKHLETHTGVIAKPFVCDFCGIGFRRNMDLKDHRTIHTGERPYSCDQCGSNFSARSSFYTHMRKVHGISLLARKKEEMAK